jgi:hypothetical protein
VAAAQLTNNWYRSFNIVLFQGVVERVLLLLSLAMIPLMLFGKPFFLWRASKKASKRESTSYNQLVSQDSENDDYLEAGRHQVCYTHNFTNSPINFMALLI